MGSAVFIGQPINEEIGVMRYIFFSIFIFLFHVFECLAAEVLLKCMDAKGIEKEFLIVKDLKTVTFFGKTGGVLGSFEETSQEYYFKFPETTRRSAAKVKINRNNGMIEFETGKLPHLSIIWTANCSELSR